jgi:mRNA-degrading endonuclease RelE of RelBE toxin-antitoxin system
VRVGDYRIVYRIDAGARVVRVERIRHRKDAYRGL